jgi:hypothetical protein
MGLKGSIYYYCYNRNKRDKTPFLIFIKNNIDLGNIPFYLPKLF